MSTSGGISFKADESITLKMQRYLDDLNEIVNNNGLGVSCTPTIDTIYGVAYLQGQTHWSYDGTNGRMLVEEIKKWLDRHEIKIEIISEWYA